MPKSSTMRNLVIVSYDSVRADVAYSLLLPGIEHLRTNGTTFQKVVSSSPLTPVSHATVMTGLQPYRHGIRHLFRERLRDDAIPLAVLLQDHGFHTTAVVSCPGLNRWYGFDRGFQHFDDEIPALPDGTDPLQTVDVKLRGQALKRAPLVIDRSLRLFSDVSASRKSSFFHFIHFFDAHWPYEPPTDTPGVVCKNAYEGEVAYLDSHFKQWFDWMDGSGFLEETLVVLFGDHGEDLHGWYPGDRGGEEGDHPEEKGHGALLYDQTLLVPLIFYNKEFPRRDSGSLVRLVDIMPTCLDLLGIPPPPGLDGRSLASVVRGEGPALPLPAYSETLYPREQVEATGGMFSWTRDLKAVRIDDRYKVIFHIDSDIVELYDLQNDPLERYNLLAPEPTPKPQPLPTDTSLAASSKIGP
jgi:arylsulfatase